MTLLLILGLLRVPAAVAAEVKTFCSMEQGAKLLLEAAGIPADLSRDDDVRGWAEALVARRLAEHPDAPVSITWQDVYELRGTVNAWLCRGAGNALNCVGGTLDAVGSGLLGSRLGRLVMKGGMALSGPPGWVLVSGMGVTQETLQCRPSAVRMAVEAGAGVVALIPWCKVPGIERGCAVAGEAAKRGALAAARRFFGDRVSAQVVRASARGVEVSIARAPIEAAGLQTAAALEALASKGRPVAAAAERAAAGEGRVAVEEAIRKAKAAGRPGPRTLRVKEVPAPRMAGATPDPGHDAASGSIEEIARLKGAWEFYKVDPQGRPVRIIDGSVDIREGWTLARRHKVTGAVEVDGAPRFSTREAAERRIQATAASVKAVPAAGAQPSAARPEPKVWVFRDESEPAD